MTTAACDRRTRFDTAVPACADPDPIGLLREEHALQLELCDLLEAVADALPDDFNRSLASAALAILETGFPAHKRFEAEALFPLLRERGANDSALLAAIDRLDGEHEAEEATLIELMDLLQQAAQENSHLSANTFGYALRGFFDSHRRHIGWEETILIPAASRLLRAEDLRDLQSWIMASDQPRCIKHSLVAIRTAKSGLELCRQCPSASSIRV